VQEKMQADFEELNQKRYRIMTSGYNNGGIAPINRVNLENDAQVGLRPNNYYDTSKIQGVNQSVRYEQNMDPTSFSFLSKTSPFATGLNPFQNNFTEQILAYKDDGTILTGRTIGIG